MRHIVPLTESKRAKFEPTREGVLLTFEGRDQFNGTWYEGACFVLDPFRVALMQNALDLAMADFEQKNGVAA